MKTLFAVAMIFSLGQSYALAECPGTLEAETFGWGWNESLFQNEAGAHAREFAEGAAHEECVYDTVGVCRAIPGCDVDENSFDEAFLNLNTRCNRERRGWHCESTVNARCSIDCISAP